MNRRGTSLQGCSAHVHALYGYQLVKIILLNRTFIRVVSWLKWDTCSNGSLILSLTLQGGDGHTLMREKKRFKYAATSL